MPLCRYPPVRCIRASMGILLRLPLRPVRENRAMDKPDPYAELSAVMQDLAAQGVPETDIIDAAFRLAVTAAARLYGPEAVSQSLLDMAEVVRAATDSGAH
jgi:hypothetical protein